MERIAFHIEIKDGQRDAYRDEHEDVPEWLETAYLDTDAGIETYSVFEADGHVFGYLELDDPEAIREIMSHSDAQQRWEKRMDAIVEDGETWMEEVYRMR